MANIIRIDELLISNHPFLSKSDECYFLMNYPPYSRFGRTIENTLLMDFKLSNEKCNTEYWRTKKIEAIDKIYKILEECLPKITTDNTLFVPMPTSKNKNDSSYDARLPNILHRYCDEIFGDCRELILTKETTPSTHTSARKKPEEIFANLELNMLLCDGKAEDILLVDDVITTGSHFKACKTLLESQYPLANIKGLFFGRTS